MELLTENEEKYNNEVIKNWQFLLNKLRVTFMILLKKCTIFFLKQFRSLK